MSGIVERFGPETESDLALGDRVFGLSSSFGFGNPVGSYAEYTVIPADQLARIPEGLSFGDAAALPLVGLTALQALEAAALKPGQRLFISAGSGGLGMHAIQLAKARGLHVTTSCSGKNADRVRQVGADEVFDYTQGNLVAQFRDAPFDAVIDCLGGAQRES